MRALFTPLAILAASALATGAAPTPAPSAATPAPAAQAEVRIANFTFGPPVLRVKPGTTVTWLNDDDVPHTVVARNGAFRSRALDTGDRFAFTFAKAGEFDYFCSLHPHMVGKIVVQG